MEFNDIWPPAYRVKKHPKARQVRLRASLNKGLELIVPSRFNIKKIPALLDDNRSWIEQQFLQLRQKSSFLEVLPEKIEFPTLSQTWHIQYIPCQAPAKILSRPHNEIVLIGDIENKNACRKKLIQWIKAQAKIHLPIQLEKISQMTGLPFSKITIRNQQTRWGSCSTKKSINLNYKLLFLPEALAHHVMIHELCHTVHFNHSEKFWGLVAQFDLNWLEHNKALKRANKFVPQWLSSYDGDF